jgi:carboxymethylenebutenolidase
LNDFQRYVAEEFVDDYRAGHLSRRGMLRRIGLITGGAAMAVGFLKELGIEATAEEVLAAGPEAAPTSQRSAVTISPDDPQIRAGWIVFRAEDGAPIIGYLARPSAAGANQGVLVVHENRGLNEHILDVTRRFARDGFTALAVDLLSRAGGTGGFNDPAQISATLSGAGPERNTGDLSAGVAALVARDDVRPGGVGVTGYCFGGGMAWRLATTDPNIVAAAPYYGIAPPLENVPNIRGPVLAIYAGNDERINASWPPLKDALDAAGKTYQLAVYPGTNHAFHSDTGQSYNEGAARDAYQGTVAWFRQYLPQA